MKSIRELSEKDLRDRVEQMKTELSKLQTENSKGTLRKETGKIKKVVNLKREEASHLTKTGDLYDGLINDYEYGMTKSEVSEIFDKMKPRLINLKEKIGKSEVEISKINGDFDASKQLALSKEIARVFHYDFDRGRIDTVTHPFCSGNGDDVRVTTRTDLKDPFNCIYSTIHEVGHASYEQNINSSYNLTPLGSGVSLGIHESQSRIFENQLGRSRAFTKWLFKKLRENFSSFDIKNEEDFYRIVNKVSPGFIRTEADEIHYNLHIMLRIAFCCYVIPYFTARIRLFEKIPLLLIR